MRVQPGGELGDHNREGLKDPSELSSKTSEAKIARKSEEEKFTVKSEEEEHCGFT